MNIKGAVTIAVAVMVAEGLITRERAFHLLHDLNNGLTGKV